MGRLSAERRLLVDRMRADRAEAGTPALRPRPSDEALAPLSYAQEQIWLLEQLLGPAVVGSSPVFLRVTGALDTEALRRAVTALIGRHEALRTTIAMVGGEPRQEIHPPPFVDFEVVDVAGRDDEACAEYARQELARGFDVRTGPILRTRVYRRAAEDAFLLVARHHLLVDAASDAVFLAELGELYVAEVTGTPAALPELSVQYPDFAVWQRNCLTDARTEALVSYWDAKLADPPRPLSLPGTRPRPPLRTTRGEFLVTPLTAERSAGMLALAKAERVTPFMLLLAILRVVLWRATGERDVLVGTPMNGRTRPETQALIGFLLNMLVLRHSVDDGLTVRGLLAGERDSVLEAYDHQELPYALLARRLARPMAFLQVVFAYEQAESSALTLPGLAVAEVDLGLAVSQNDLEVKVVRDGAAMTVHWAYDDQIIDRATVSSMAAAFEACLAAAIDRPDLPLGELPTIAGITATTSVVPDQARPTGRSTRPPSGAIEEQIAEVWRELGHHPVTADDDLFALGGHSLTVAKLAFQLEVAFGLTVPVADLFTHPTVAGQAEHIERLLRARLSTIDSAEVERKLNRD
ncbi:condensation domain-containing protein [Amycolatopsis sp. cmx-11-12]|uniref:condensation domain-containing protein n=1 Tax=Amycolatopsis sp. cmx-11-12 TaxID=2785795 RepID=UPI0039174F66